MSYVLVSADFPGISSEQRTKIYECLKKNNWIKVQEPGRDISTAWYASYGDSIIEKMAIQASIDYFVNCSKPFCTPKLVLHWGPNRPTFHGLT